jgi:hypothetical protein
MELLNKIILSEWKIDIVSEFEIREKLKNKEHKVFTIKDVNTKFKFHKWDDEILVSINTYNEHKNHMDNLHTIAMSSQFQLPQEKLFPVNLTQEELNKNRNNIEKQNIKNHRKFYSPHKITIDKEKFKSELLNNSNITAIKLVPTNLSDPNYTLPHFYLIVEISDTIFIYLYVKNCFIYKTHLIS